MRSTVWMCFAANNILLVRNCNHDLWWKIADCSSEPSESDLNKKTKFGDRMIKQLLNSVITKYRYLSVYRRSIPRLRQIIDLQDK